MSQYSEMIGSFIRTGNYPLEADYIFSTELELKDFYKDDVLKTLLHPGLFKIVGKEDTQSLYWVVKDSEGNLEFKKLIEGVDIQYIYDFIEDLNTKLELEIVDRETSNNEILGNKDEINEALNTIEKISKELISEKTQLSKLRKEFNDSIGTSSENVSEYLETLPYKSLTEVSEALNNFLNKLDSESNSISTLLEIKNFLQGISDSDTLLKLLQNLYNSIEGDPLPSKEFSTLREVEDFIRTHILNSLAAINNILSELDQTLVGVGLSQDGSFSPDLETYYLQNATSVMNALKTLDRIIHRIKYVFDSTNTVDLTETLDEDTNVTTITADVKLSSKEKNQISAEEDGLYHMSKLEYANGILTHTVNGKVISTHDLGISGIVDDSYYDSTTERIVIIFKLHNGGVQRVEIPVDKIIEELSIENPSDSPIELTRIRVVNGSDKLSADIRLSSKNNNILIKDGDTLYVKGTSDNIAFGGTTVENELNKKVNSINLKISDANYTSTTSDIYEVKSNNGTDELLLTFTPISPLTLTVPETIGDILKGTTSQSLKGKPLSEILDSIIFKTIYPTITEPSATIIHTTPTALIEATNSVMSISDFSYNFDRGNVVVNDGVTTSIPYVGTIIRAVYKVRAKGGTANTNAGVDGYPDISWTASEPDAAPNVITRYEPGTYQYRIRVDYNAGPLMATSKGANPNPMPTTNKGNVDNPHRSSTIYSSWGIVRNVTLPVFVDTASGTYTKLALREWGAMTYTGVNMQNTSKATPIKIKTPRKLSSVNSYNAVSGKYDVPLFSNFTMTPVTENINGADYNYYEYVWTGGALAAVNMEIKTY